MIECCPSSRKTTCRCLALQDLLVQSCSHAQALSTHRLFVGLGCGHGKILPARNIDRPPFRFHVSPTEVFPKHPDADELETSKEHDSYKERRIARYNNTSNDSSQEKVCSIDKRSKSRNSTNVSPHSERRSSKAGDALEGQIPQAPSIEFSKSSRSYRPFITYDGRR